MLFKDIKGLEEIKKQLINSAKADKVAHAQLFLGREGSFNLPLALAFANYINCEQPGEEDGCGACPSCSKNLKFIHPDIHFVFPVSGTAKVKSVDAVSKTFLKEWRQFLSEKPYGNIETWSGYYGGEDKQVNISKEESRQIIKNLSLKSFEAKYKVMIIWQPEYMHPFAANGILKILEEPPAKTIFLLVSNNRDRLISTIISRTQIVTVPTPSDTHVQELLQDIEGIESNQASLLAQLADGSLQKALKLSQNIDSSDEDFFASWMRECFSNKFGLLVERAENFHRLNKVAQKSMLQYSLQMLREALVYELAPTIRRSEANSDFLTKFSKIISEEKISPINKKISEAFYHLERNASPKITFLDLSLHIARILK